MQVELQCALTVRDRLAEKLTNAEREAQTLRSSEGELRAQVQREAQVSELLRLRVDACERQSAELRAQTDNFKEEVQIALTERDQLALTLAEKAARETVQQSELTALRSQIEALQGSLTSKNKDLESASTEAERLVQEKQNLQVAFASYKENNGIEDNQQLKVIASYAQKVDQLSKKIESAETELGQEQGTTTELQARNSALKQQLTSAEQQRVELHNAIQELKGNIRVYCRIRPPAPGIDLALCHPEPNKMQLRHGLDQYAFNFDKVFGASAEQAEVFEEVAGLVQSALDGFKVCIFAYGQTGSGKTYTMQGPAAGGDVDSEGLIPRALMAIFDASEKMQARGWSWSVKVSFMEVYNETLRDLLRGSGDAAAGPTDGYVIAQHESWGTMVTGMSCIEVDSIDRVNLLMARAAKQRAVGATDVHALSSRSHSVFALYLKGTNLVLGSEIHGALHLVDLAGSERLDKSGSTGERLKETRNINRSLSSLADVFAAKAEGRGHVPFRNSKLTHLLEPCLSGQGKTLMLVTVQPENRNAHETLCSLRFAKQVSQCNTGGKPRRSVKNLGQGAGPPPQSAASSPHAPEPREVPTNKSLRLSLQKSSQQQVASMRQRASSMEPVGGQPGTPRGRAAQEQRRRSIESGGGGSPRTTSRPMTARETQRRSVDSTASTAATEASLPPSLPPASRVEVKAESRGEAKADGRGDSRPKETRVECRLDAVKFTAVNAEGGRFARNSDVP